MTQIKNKKRFAFFIAIAVLIIAVTIWGIIKFKNRNNPENQPQVYEALVNIVDQKAADPIEDARGSLKRGDVISVFPEGHPWSETEKISYLIVKLKITPDDAEKLTRAKTREVKRKTPEANSESDVANMKDMKEEEIILARQYQIKLPDFDTQKFWSTHEQPFKDKVFDDGIIKKK